MPDLASLASAGDGLLAEVAAQAHGVAAAEGIADTGYRIVFNTGAKAGQTVPTRTRTFSAAGRWPGRPDEAGE